MTKKYDKDKTLIQTVLQKNNICDDCIGRILNQNNNEKSMKKQGKKIRAEFKIEKEIPGKSCDICDGLTNEIETITTIILSELKPYEFNSFIIGFHMDEEFQLKEEEILTSLDISPEKSIKNHLQKTIGSTIEKKINIPVQFEHADIMVIFNTMFNTLTLQIKSLYIYGRYKKFQRGIPQTKWFCRSCRGKGCRRCKYTGTLYEESVEEIIAKHFMNITKGSDESFHGSGREDIDVKMLGNGRPFVLEINNSVKRTIDFEEITNKINTKNKDKIEVSHLRLCLKSDIKRIKESKFAKVYQVKFEAEKPFNREKLKKVAVSLRGATIEQFTPTRVAKRRANKVRTRHIYDCKVIQVEKNIATFAVESAAGTYIKELVTGDDGKTKPNISELIGQPCTVKTLDVVEIKGE